MNETLVIAANNFDLKLAILIFVAYVVFDAFYALYTLHVTRLNEWRASNSAVIVNFISAFAVINYTQNWLYIVPLLAGSWVGTFIVVRNQRIKKTKE
jgi:hypothetical protein